MRGPDGIDTQLVFEDIRVKGLNRGWHGIADIGVGLMPVEAPELDLFAVKIKAVVFKSYSPEAEADAALINDPARFTGLSKVQSSPPGTLSVNSLPTAEAATRPSVSIISVMT